MKGRCSQVRPGGEGNTTMVLNWDKGLQIVLLPLLLVLRRLFFFLLFLLYPAQSSWEVFSNYNMIMDSSAVETGERNPMKWQRKSHVASSVIVKMSLESLFTRQEAGLWSGFI